MDRVTYFIALTDPDEIAEVVGDDSQVVAVIADIGGQESAVAPALNDLLAMVGRSPIHFHPELIRFDETRRLPQPLADLRQEEHESVSPCPVARESRVGLNLEPPVYGTPYEGQCGGGFQL